jgi:hypothetical protein
MGNRDRMHRMTTYGPNIETPALLIDMYIYSPSDRYDAAETTNRGIPKNFCEDKKPNDGQYGCGDGPIGSGNGDNTYQHMQIRPRETNVTRTAASHSVIDSSTCPLFLKP